MRKYTRETMRDIGNFYEGDRKEIRHLLKEFGEWLDGVGVSRYTLNHIYWKHETAYLKRVKNGKPNVSNVATLKIEIDVEKEEPQYRLGPWKFCRN